ncbi:spermidine/putrescine-binding protein [Bradyrhizobium sp. F1.2.2]
MFETPAPFLAGLDTAAPQLSQNLAEGEIAASHLAHVVARSLPQLAQNLAPFRFSVPQDEQRISADLFSMPPGSPNDSGGVCYKVNASRAFLEHAPFDGLKAAG